MNSAEQLLFVALGEQVDELTKRVQSLEDALCAIAGVARGVSEDKATLTILQGPEKRSRAEWRQAVKRAKAARVG